MVCALSVDHGYDVCQYYTDLDMQCDQTTLPCCGLLTCYEKDSGVDVCQNCTGEGEICDKDIQQFHKPFSRATRRLTFQYILFECPTNNFGYTRSL